VAPANPDPATLSGISLFRGLPAGELERLAPLLHKWSFPSGANVIIAEEKGDSVYVILEGTAKVYVTHTDGTEVILAILGPGEIVGEMSAADSLGRSASVLTLEESTLLWMDRHTFLSSMEEVPAIARNLIGILSRRLRLADTNTRSLAALDVHGRVAIQLLAFAREYGEPLPDGGVLIPLRLTQTDLGGLVGASRVRVNQVLGYYRRRGEISLDKEGCIIVHDEEALTRRARQDSSQKAAERF
jgi:CRP/FNR family transcriptional regulator, cyclic AMP receptor protein